VIHDAVGMRTAPRNHADWLADEGLLAVAPELFYGGRRSRWLLTFFLNARQHRPTRAITDLDAAGAWLAARPECTGTTDVIGFCLGGGYAPRPGVVRAPTARQWRRSRRSRRPGCGRAVRANAAGSSRPPPGSGRAGQRVVPDTVVTRRTSATPQALARSVSPSLSGPSPLSWM
jgi:hypothetical protein